MRASSAASGGLCRCHQGPEHPQSHSINTVALSGCTMVFQREGGAYKTTASHPVHLSVPWQPDHAVDVVRALDLLV
eukprot:12881968-Prorocentrum_lima.AAC.1